MTKEAKLLYNWFWSPPVSTKHSRSWCRSTQYPILHLEEGGVVCPRGSHAELRVGSGAWITTTAQVWSGCFTGRVCGSSRTRWRTRRCSSSSTSTSRSAATTKPPTFWRITSARWVLRSRCGFVVPQVGSEPVQMWVQNRRHQASAADMFNYNPHISQVFMYYFSSSLFRKNLNYKL